MHAQSCPSDSPRGERGLRAVNGLTRIDAFTRVVVQLGVQVLLLGVEPGVDAVHRGHQGEGPDGGGDEEAHFGVGFVQGAI